MYHNLKQHSAFMAVLALALILRLVLAWVAPGAGYDIESYRLQGQAVLQGENVYAVTFRYPYPPLWLYWPALALKLAEATSWPFHFCVKLLIIAADVGIGWLLWQWPRPSPASVRRAAWYWFNPVVLLISTLHGQFDALVIFMVLLAARWWLERRLVMTALSLGVSVALKGFPLLLLPAFLLGLATWSQAVAFAVVVGSVLLIISLPYLAQSGDRIARILLFYNSTADHSYSYVLSIPQAAAGAEVNPALTMLRQASRLLEAGVVLGLAVLGALRHWLLEYRLAAAILAIYAIAPGLASQQMLWVIPFLILTRHAGAYWIYTLISTAALVLFYGQYFPLVLGLSAAWTGDQLLPVRGAIELIWWLAVIALLSWVVYQQFRHPVPTASIAVGK
jgi:hypothetical protein